MNNNKYNSIVSLTGYVKVGTAIPALRIGECDFNAEEIIRISKNAVEKGVKLLAFPELSVTGYTCGDLFGQNFLLDKALAAIAYIKEQLSEYDIVVIIGAPLRIINKLYNCAFVIYKGEILGAVPKIYLPNYSEFYEARWFESGELIFKKTINTSIGEITVGNDLLFESTYYKFAIEICEDLWVPLPPSTKKALLGADIIVNLSASNEMVGKHEYLRSLISQQSARTISGYIYSSAGFGESTTDLVFAGNALIFENGNLIAAAERFCFEPQLITSDIDIDRLRSLRQRTSTYLLKDSDYKITASEIVFSQNQVDYAKFPFERSYNPTPFVPSGESQMHERCNEIFNIQVNGLAQRIIKSFAKSLVIGISGGLDSTLALLVCIQTVDKLKMPRESIVGITMPGFGTTDRTYNNAINLMKRLGVTIREISIKDACLQHFKDLGIDGSVHDVTYENSQARERTQILMDAANQTSGIVIGTGDLSELALGWATYNGDHMSMYGVNTSIPKTLVKYLVKWVALHNLDKQACDILMDIIDTPISPELIPADENGDILQKTEDLVGPYELHDFFLYHFIRFADKPSKIFFLAQKAFENKYDRDTIKKWLTIFFRRFFAQQFKRSCLPDGPKVGSVTLSPRGDWRMPSDISAAMWLKEIESL